MNFCQRNTKGTSGSTKVEERERALRNEEEEEETGKEEQEEAILIVG